MTVVASAEPARVEFRETRVPLEGIEETIAGILEAHGGSTWAGEGSSMNFRLPVRQGVAASGAIEGLVRWSESETEGGIVTVVADREVDPNRGSKIALLSAGTVGALLWLLWPFYPALGTLSWIGGAMAFAAWFLTLRRTRGGLMARLAEAIAEEQRAFGNDERRSVE